MLVCALGWCPSATARAKEELPSRGSRRETADGVFSASAEKAAESHHLYNTKRTNYSHGLILFRHIAQIINARNRIGKMRKKHVCHGDDSAVFRV